jgi:hypothetical protein
MAVIKYLYILQGKLLASLQVLVKENCVVGYVENFIYRTALTSEYVRTLITPIMKTLGAFDRTHNFVVNTRHKTWYSWTSKDLSLPKGRLQC